MSAPAAAAWRLPVGRGPVSCYLKLAGLRVPCGPSSLEAWDGMLVPGSAALSALAWAALLGGAAFWVYYLAYLVHRPFVHHRRSSYLAHVVRHIGGLRRRYWPTFWLANGHLQTIYSVFAPDNVAVEYEREMLEVHALQEGRLPGRVAIDWAVSKQYLPPDTPILIVLHGLTGGARERYVKVLIDRVMRSNGWRAVGVNFRGCGGVMLETAQAFCASYTDDVRQIVRHVHARYPRAQLFAAGYSLGANIMTKFVGEEGEGCLLSGAVAFANPFNLLESSEHLHSTCLHRAVYSRKLAANLRRLASGWVHMFDQVNGIDVKALGRVDTVRDFDEQYTRRSFGYGSVDEYYHDGSSSRVMENVGIPLLCLSAMDDPVCYHGSIPYAACEKNPNVLLVVTRSGGHSMDWFSGPFASSWSARVAADFLATVFSLVPPRGGERTNFAGPQLRAPVPPPRRDAAGTAAAAAAEEGAAQEEGGGVAGRVGAWKKALGHAERVLEHEARTAEHVAAAVAEWPRVTEQVARADERHRRAADPFIARRRKATAELARMRAELEAASHACDAALARPSRAQS